MESAYRMQRASAFRAAGRWSGPGRSRSAGTLLVGVEDRHQGAFRNVEAFPEEVDADEHVEGAEPQVADDLDPLQRVDVGVHVAHAHAVLVQVLGEVLGHALGQRGHQRPVAGLGDRLDLAQQVVDLGAGRADLDHRVDQAGGADHLLGEDAAGALHLPLAGRGRDVDRLRPHRVPFLEAQRPVVQAGRQAEAVLGQRRLPAEVAPVHAADLGHGDVALVGEDQGVVGQVLEQGRRRLAGPAAGEVARIVLDAVAGAGGLDHLDIEGAALVDALGLDQPAHLGQLLDAGVQLVLDPLDRLLQRRPRRDVVELA